MKTQEDTRNRKGSYLLVHTQTQRAGCELTEAKWKLWRSIDDSRGTKIHPETRRVHEKSTASSDDWRVREKRKAKVGAYAIDPRGLRAHLRLFGHCKQELSTLRCDNQVSLCTHSIEELMQGGETGG